jgi:hypothetical protein
MYRIRSHLKSLLILMLRVQIGVHRFKLLRSHSLVRFVRHLAITKLLLIVAAVVVEILFVLILVALPLFFHLFTEVLVAADSSRKCIIRLPDLSLQLVHHVFKAGDLGI